MLPNALLFGMTSEQFFNDNPQLYWVYGKKYELEIKEKYREISYNGWINNQYTGIILSSTFGKGGNKYPSVPFGFEEQNVDKEMVLQNKITAMMSRAMVNYDKNHPKNLEQKEGDDAK